MLTNLWTTLAGLLGVMQALTVQWWLVVVLGDEGLGAADGAALGAALLGANVVSIPVLRRARMAGRGRLATRLYMAVGIFTLLVGFAVALSWIGLFPLAQVVGWLGFGVENAFLSFRVVSALFVFTVLAMTLWAFTGGQTLVDRTRIQVPIVGLHPDHRGLRIGHLTDLHIGNGLEGERLSNAVRQGNTLGADVLVLTGDIFDFDPSVVEDGVRRLAALRAPHGVYAILGNHDVYTGADDIAGAFRRLAPEVRLLRDEIVRLPVASPLYLAGCEDTGRDWTARDLRFESLERLAAERPDDGPTLLLVHRPELFGQAAKMGFPLVLAGHTHGGQLALPLPGGRHNLARVVSPLTRGLYRSSECTLYVNRGLGVGGPKVRINCPREIATIELT